MESKNLLTLAITLTVGIILAGSLLMPVISDATKTTETFTNTGLYRMAEYDTTGETVIVWDSANPLDFIVDGETVKVKDPETTSYFMTTAGGSNFLVRFGHSSGAYFLQVFDNTATGVRFEAGTQDNDVLTITVANGTVTFDKGDETPFVETYETAFIMSPDGDYIMKEANKPAYVNGNSTVYGIGRTYYSVFTVNINYMITASVDDGITNIVNYPYTITHSNETVNYTTVSGYKDLYAIESLTFTETDDQNRSANATYSQIIVPYQVTAELSNHLNDGEIAIMSAIPLMMIVALLVMAAGALYLKRSD